MIKKTRQKKKKNPLKETTYKSGDFLVDTSNARKFANVC